jgi:hypothetical protein
MTDLEFLRAFEEGKLPAHTFHHRDHVRLAYLHLRRSPLPEAIARFRDGLRRFAAAQGKPELYHETITLAYLFLIHERLATGGSEEGFPAFAARNPDLFAWHPSILESYYRPETLGSDLARRVFVLPDRGRAAGP